MSVTMSSRSPSAHRAFLRIPGLSGMVVPPPPAPSGCALVCSMPGVYMCRFLPGKLDHKKNRGVVPPAAPGIGPRGAEHYGGVTWEWGLGVLNTTELRACGDRGIVVGVVTADWDVGKEKATVCQTMCPLEHDNRWVA